MTATTQRLTQLTALICRQLPMHVTIHSDAKVHIILLIRKFLRIFHSFCCTNLAVTCKMTIFANEFCKTVA